jgi:hypothetical protein
MKGSYWALCIYANAPNNYGSRLFVHFIQKDKIPVTLSVRKYKLSI